MDRRSESGDVLSDPLEGADIARRYSSDWTAQVIAKRFSTVHRL
jgi:hypothetical protein